MIVECVVYRDGARVSGRLTLDEAVAAVRSEPGAFAWLALHEPDEAELEVVAKELDLHELAVEDAVNAAQRPKLEVYDEMVFAVVPAARYDDLLEQIDVDEVMAFVGHDFVVTVRYGPRLGLDQVRIRLDNQARLLTLGPAAVLHAVLDAVVDDYDPVLSGLEIDIDEVEEDVFSASAAPVAERIYRLKREVLVFHRATSMLVEPLDRLSHRDIAVVPAELRPFFRDVSDHLMRVTAQVSGYRELLTSVLEANLAQVSVRQNEDMRKISAWVAIVAAPTLIAGIYGMNFEHMPELGWRYGYPAALGLIGVICVALHRAFRRAGWL